MQFKANKFLERGVDLHEEKLRSFSDFSFLLQSIFIRVVSMKLSFIN